MNKNGNILEYNLPIINLECCMHVAARRAASPPPPPPHTHTHTPVMQYNDFNLLQEKTYSHMKYIINLITNIICEPISCVLPGDILCSPKYKDTKT